MAFAILNFEFLILNYGDDSGWVDGLHQTRTQASAVGQLTVKAGAIKEEVPYQTRRFEWYLQLAFEDNRPVEPLTLGGTP